MSEVWLYLLKNYLRPYAGRALWFVSLAKWDRLRRRWRAAGQTVKKKKE
jgi:hypothetical protein